MPRIDAVLFDLDGTLVRYHGIDFESSWGAVAAAAGVTEASQRLMREYLPRRAAYPEWVARDAQLLTGIPLERVTAEVLPAPYAAGVREAVSALRGRYCLGILSSGVDLVADWVRDDLGMDFALANHLEVVDGRFTGRSETRVDLWAKAEAMTRIVEARGWSLDCICFVGDHFNDMPAMRLVGLSVAANPKDDRLTGTADHVIDDFRELPDLIAAHERANGS